MALIEGINNVLWGTGTLLIFVGVGLMFTVRTGWFQFCGVRLWMSKTLGSVLRPNVRRSAEKGSISQFQALSSSLAACMGTGNIVGVAAALCSGGAGAVLWMWISAVLGMMTSCAENVLGMKYREKNRSGEWVGSSMLYIQAAFRSKIPAVAFSVFCMGAAFGMGNITQSNALARALEGEFSLSPYVSGAAAALLAGAVIFGGIGRIAKVTEKIIPLISAVFILGCVAVIAVNYKRIPSAAHAIVAEGLSMKSAAGGIAGYSLSRTARVGISKGVFSNEAGLGSSPIIHCATDVTEPTVQGMWGMTEVFLDTVVMCTVTAFTILCSGVQTNGAALSPAPMCSVAFSGVFGAFAGKFVAVCVAVYGYATLVGWSFYGEKASQYIFGERSPVVYRCVYTALIFLGAISPLAAVWELSDMMNALMAIPNLAALTLLSGEAAREINRYAKNERKSSRKIT